ncbi:MAG: hypothetical protein Q7J57_17120 [Gemmobacter sp.]|nr:hypothetical protein [Gemmobacter sp.]
MLAHKATREGKAAAEVACVEKPVLDAAVTPSVACTDPEGGWDCLTEIACKVAGCKVKIAAFPWMAAGRALSMGRPEGRPKLIFDDSTGKTFGAGIVGPGAGELIAEVVLVIEMSADAEDIGHSIDPHPDLWRRSPSRPRSQPGRSLTSECRRAIRTTKEGAAQWRGPVCAWGAFNSHWGMRDTMVSAIS